MLFPPPPPQQLPEDQIATNQSLEQEILITDNQSQSNIEKHKTNLNITEDDYKKQTQHLVKLLSTPVPKNNNNLLNPNDCFIGPFKGSTLFYYITPKEFQELHLGYQSTNKYTTFQAHLRSIVKKENTFNDDLYARFDTQTDSIFLHYSQPKNFKKDTPIPQMLAECNLIQNLLSATHEINHRTDFNSLQSYNLYSSPINDAKFSLFSEKKSIATELLTLTNLYHKLKEQGVNTFSFTTLIENTPQTISPPIEDLLQIHPLLKETVSQYGSDISNPKTLKEIIKTSSHLWDVVYSKDYISQHETQLKNKYIYQNMLSFSKQIRCIKASKNHAYQDRLYNKMIHNASKKTYIGTGEELDLTPYITFFDTSHDIEFNTTLKKFQQETKDLFIGSNSKQLLLIDKYLEQIGLTTDADKDSYLQTEFIKIINRDFKADLELKELMLSDNGSIKYTDGLEETRYKDLNLSTISKTDGNTYIIDTFTNYIPNKTSPSKQTTIHNNILNHTKSNTR